MSALAASAPDSTELKVERDHQLNLRLLRFRNRADSEEPAMLAFELVAVSRSHDALEVIDAALARDPEDIDLLLGCGMAACRSGQLAFAQMVLTRAAKAAPEWVEPLTWLAKVLALRGRESQSLDVMRRAIALGARDADMTERVKKHDRKASLDARLAAWQSDQELDDPALLAQELLTEERIRDALSVLEQAIEQGDDPDLRVIEARAWIAHRDPDRACVSLKKAIGLAPEWSEPARMLAELRLEHAAPVEALGIVDHALAANVADEALLALRTRIEEVIEEAGILLPDPKARAIVNDTSFDEFLATLDRIDPIGEDTRRGFAKSDTLIDEPSPPDRRKQRRGWLPKIARALFRGESPPSSLPSAEPKRTERGSRAGSRSG